MIGASKILTVSYGTFSCTLEGFDDPFNTMKAIAEYFRDLAAGDRYFGAEPPTPDAAMLHQIAEREIQRRVEARVQDNGVILRAADGAPAQIAAPPPLMPRSLAASVSDDPAMAARLERIRSAVAHSAPQAEAPPPPPPAAEAAPPEDSLPEDSLPEPGPEALPEDLSPPGPTADDAPPVPEAAPAFLAEPDFPAAPEADFGAELARDAAADETTAAPAFAEIAPDDAGTGFQSPGPQPDRVRARVIRIRRAPAQPAETVEALPPMAAVETTATSLSAEAEADLLRELAELEAELAPAADPAPEILPEAETIAEPAFAAPTESDSFEDDLAALDLSALDLAEDLDPQPETDLAETDLTETDLTDAPLPDDLATFADDADFDAAAVLAETGFADQETDPAPAAVLTDAADADDWEDEILSAPAFPPAMDTRDDADEFEAELEAALNQPLPEIAPEIAPDLPPVAAAEDDEADLLAESPNAEAPAPVRPARPVRPVRRLRVARAPQQPEAEAQRPARDRLPATVDPVNEEEAVKRLLAETNNQMDGADSRRRLSAIAHLKAAVAATVADRRAGSSLRKSEEERVEPYREDLSRIVRPAQVGTTPRPAPLVLVSELRVDPAPAVRRAPARPAEPATPAAAAPQPGPVRPRRVGSAALAPQHLADEDEDEIEAPLAPEEARGFADFADRLGAVGLSGLLEAAAAYSACIEGRPHFSRPQLMRQVGSMAEDNGHSREDSLRSFGTLLREGRIVKVRRGQYALAEDSHLLAKARKLVG